MKATRARYCNKCLYCTIRTIANNITYGMGKAGRKPEGEHQQNKKKQQRKKTTTNVPIFNLNYFIIN